MHVAGIAFLPLGADLNTVVYRVTADDGTSYFLKLRSGLFDETSVAPPKFLGDQGIAAIIAPLAYYRYERIIEDIAVYCEQLLLSNDGGADREQTLRYLMSNFKPNGAIEIAWQADEMLPER